MKTISIKNINGVNIPTEPFPVNAKKIIIQGSNYVVYEEGDVLPPEMPSLVPIGEFLGKEIYTNEDVKRTVANAIADMFSASQGRLDVVSDQFKIISEMIAINFAKMGWLTWTEIGISEITDTASAQAYFNTNIKPLWVQRNILRQQAKEFITTHA